MRKLTLIACIDVQGLIGLDNKLPWKIPEDMAHFKEYTMGKPVIMGSKTFYSLPYPLEGRLNIVVSSDETKFDNYLNQVTSECVSTGKDMPQLAFTASLDSFFESDLEELGNELVCIGGGKMYEQLLPFATDLIITRLNKKHTIPEESKDSAVFFPPVDNNEWEITKKEELKSSLGVELGEILHLRSKSSYDNVYSFQTRKSIDVSEFYCASNGIGSVFEKYGSVLIEEDE